MEKIPSSTMRGLKARGQRLEPMFKVGKSGLSDGFIKSIDEGLAHHELIKIKFVEFKEEKKILCPQLAEKTSSHIIMRVGNVVVLYRENKKASV